MTAVFFISASVSAELDVGAVVVVAGADVDVAVDVGSAVGVGVAAVLCFPHVRMERYCWKERRRWNLGVDRWVSGY